MLSILNQPFLTAQWTTANAAQVVWNAGAGTVSLKAASGVKGEIHRTFTGLPIARTMFGVRNMTFTSGNRVRAIFRNAADTTGLHDRYYYSTTAFNSGAFGAISYVDLTDTGFKVRLFCDDNTFEIVLGSFDIVVMSEIGGDTNMLPALNRGIQMGRLGA